MLWQHVLAWSSVAVPVSVPSRAPDAAALASDGPSANSGQRNDKSQLPSIRYRLPNHRQSSTSVFIPYTRFRCSWLLFSLGSVHSSVLASLPSDKAIRYATIAHATLTCPPAAVSFGPMHASPLEQLPSNPSTPPSLANSRQLAFQQIFLSFKRQPVEDFRFVCAG